jgi:RNA polymerase sigma factor (sigma-70 family)
MSGEPVKGDPAGDRAGEVARLQALFGTLRSGGRDAPQALGTIHDICKRRLYASLRARGFTRDEANDIMQTAFLKLVERTETLEDIQNPLAFLYRVVSNCANDYLRSKQRRGSTTDIEEADEDEAPTSDGFDDCLERAFAELEKAAPDRGLAVRLAAEGFSGPDIAEALGRTYGAARELLSQARKQFETILFSLCSDYVPANLRLGTSTHGA